MALRKIVMEYHHDPEGWWAKSPDLPGFSAAGDSFEEIRELAHDGAVFHLGEVVAVEDRLMETPATP